MQSYNGFSPDERMRGERAYKEAVRRGMMKAVTSCEMCTQTRGQIMYHLEDYSRPLRGHGLCVECHMTLHIRFARPNIWRAYCLKLRSGYVSHPWASVGEWMNANPFPRYDAKPVPPFEPRGTRWWEMLALKPVDLRQLPLAARIG